MPSGTMCQKRGGLGLFAAKIVAKTVDISTSKDLLLLIASKPFKWVSLAQTVAVVAVFPTQDKNRPSAIII